MANVGKIEVDILLNIKEFKSKLNQVSKDMSSIGKDLTGKTANISKQITTSTKTLSENMKKTSDGVYDLSKRIMNSIKGFIIYRGINFLVSGVTTGISEVIKTFNMMETSTLGLKSTLIAQGRSFQEANTFIQGYIKDGLIPLSDAIQTYKNLAFRGYDPKQIESLMTTMKDAAAFGRRAGLTMGEAVATASEGLRNENSLLTDNVGITQNVARMWDIYAKSIGKTAQELTLAEKRMAEVVGFQREGSIAMGDAALYSDTFAGKLQLLSVQFTYLKNAIGGVIVPIVNALMPAITNAITKMTEFFNVLAKVSALIFGYNKVQEINNKLNAKAGVAAKQAGTAQNKLGDAVKKTGKKVGDNLQSFDELNTITKEIADNSGDIAAAESLSTTPTTQTIETAIKTPDIDTSPLLEKIMEISNKIKEAFSGIDFGNLEEKFNNLKKALDPFAEKIGEGLKWFWDEVLVPLGTWVINKVIPEFLDLLTTALSALNTTIEIFKPDVVWLWDELLKPLAKWTGGVIVSVLKELNEKLKALSDWMKENKETVKGFTLTIAAFFGAWKLIQVMAFIEMSGGIVSAFSAITKAIYAATIAKLINAAQTVYLTTLYAIDFVKGIGKAIIQIGKEIALWIARAAQVAINITYTVIQTAKNWLLTASQRALNLIMLAAPWVWVAAAIAAVTAATIYLWNTNEGFRKETGTAWDSIKLAYGATLSFIFYNFSRLKIWLTEEIPNSVKAMKANFVIAMVNIGFKVADIWTDIKNAFKNGINFVIRMVNNLLDKSTAAFSSLGFNIPRLKELTLDIAPKLEDNKTSVWNKMIQDQNAILKQTELAKDNIEVMYKGLITPSEYVETKASEYAKNTYEPIDFNKLINELGLSSALNIFKSEQPTTTEPAPVSLDDNSISNLGSAMMQALQALTDNKSSTIENTINIDGTQIAKVLTPLLEKEANRLGQKVVLVT